jgi:phenylacetate-CoA ligase
MKFSANGIRRRPWRWSLSTSPGSCGLASSCKHAGSNLFRILVDVVQRQSTWHKKRLGHLNADRLLEEDLRHIPVMTKQDLMANFDSIVTDPRLTLDALEKHLTGLTDDAYLLERYHVVSSGGSSGQCGVFVYDWDAWTLCYLSLRRYSFLRNAQAERPGAGPIVMAKIGAARALHISSAIAQTFSNPSLITHSFPMTWAMQAFEKVRLERVQSLHDPLLAEIRTAAEEAWKVKVLNVWGTSEGGGCAASCGLGPWMHVADDLLIVEPVDANGGRTRSGVRSCQTLL